MNNHKYQIRAFAVLVAAVAAFSVAACSHETEKQSSEERGFVSYDEINAEYKDSVAQLDWPESYTPPADLEGEDTKLTFQSGFGDTRASILFECAWEREWLNTYATAPDQAAAAIEQLSKVPNMGYMSPQRADDATRRVFNDYLDRAKLGDPSGFQENIDINCRSN
ncbi:hypothetical protein G7Y41_03025 [Schaalia sp. ZJ405]|uniref:hypothetical protein n=1 Tax=Schaalia sp. ZJ405 TaxID=2709403 RepID=UPI0013EB55CB|nr:hypothetical protein [Schaalia sp. ZJ405]QPK81812.1 hypothetical protein G7Y41_03025 [Schaalia sp. ZJ405]